MNEYFEFTFDEEGAVHFQRYANQETLNKELNRRIQEEGHEEYISPSDIVKPGERVYDIGNRFPRGRLIIKGELVTVETVEKITQLKINK